MTLEQSTTPSSGSVTTTSYGITSPQVKKSPSAGILIWIVADVLPTVIVVVFESLSPLESVTVSRATYTPLVV